MAGSIKNSNAYVFYPYLMIGIIFITFMPPVFLISSVHWTVTFLRDTTSNSMVGNAFLYLVSSIVLRRFERFPQKNSLAFILPISLTVFSFILTIFFAVRLSYSIKIMILGLLFTIIFLVIQHFIISRSRHLKLLVVPLGDALLFKNSLHYSFITLKKPHFEEARVDGIVADMHSELLSPEWERFLSGCALKGIPVYNAMQLQESLTGKVNVRHLIVNNFGVLSPSGFLLGLKRLIDILFLILATPIILPLMIFLGLWITFDSPGGAFFIQPRMGLGGKSFNVVKFRSMYVNLKGDHFTTENIDNRITAVGKIIRKYRLDELPQFWNVLKGEMSLIGPRPESLDLATWYDNEVPFFSYRHVVRPGISGWAQVMHGYAVGVDDVKEKLAYDFYYIKHFSLWLDLLIWYKTIRTVLTGFGSR